MSRTLDLLNKAAKDPVPKVTKDLVLKGPGPESITKGPGSRFINWLPLLTLFLSAALFAIAIFQTAKNNKSAEYAKKMEKLEQAIDENNRKLLSISTDIKTDLGKIDIRLSHLKEQMSQFQRDTEANTFAVDILTKAKDNLFNRVSLLEAGLSGPKEN